MEHTVAIDDIWFNLYRQSDRDQVRDWSSFRKKLSSLAVWTKFECNLIVVLAVDIEGICYYKIVAEKETMNAARYLESCERH